MVLAAAASDAAGCELVMEPPSFDPPAGRIRAAAARGPGCETAMRVVVYLKERVFGVDRVLARGERTLRDGRVELTYGCGVRRDMEVYVQVGDTRETMAKSPVVAISGCG